MRRLLKSVKRHLVNIPGKRLDKKYVIFESDDWGSERIPSLEILEHLANIGFDMSGNPFNHLDSLETGDDISALYEVLIKYTDRSGNHPVITTNFVTANPDFEKIKASGFMEYHYESVRQTYCGKRYCENSYDMIREGMSDGIFTPQFHGREHLNIRQWLEALRSGNKVLLKAFESGVYAVDLESDYTGRSNFTAALDGMPERSNAEYELIIKEGTDLFRDIFEYVPRSFIAPCYVWHPSLEGILSENGIRYIQGLPIQYSPAPGNRYRKIFHYLGQKNGLNQLYFIRNCFFEPSLDKKFRWIEDCLKRLEIIFYWGKPAIIGTHRINFIGSLDEENRKQNLKQFSVLLEEILKNFPDVEFISTDKLGEIYNNKD